MQEKPNTNIPSFDFYQYKSKYPFLWLLFFSVLFILSAVATAFFPVLLPICIGLAIVEAQYAPIVAITLFFVLFCLSFSNADAIFFSSNKSTETLSKENLSNEPSDESSAELIFPLERSNSRESLIKIEDDSLKNLDPSRVPGPTLYRDVKNSTLYGATVDTPTSSFFPLGPN